MLKRARGFGLRAERRIRDDSAADFQLASGFWLRAERGIRVWILIALEKRVAALGF